MEKIEIPSLVTLENKPEISERPIVKIHFKGFKKEAENQIENNDLLEPVKSLVKIVNKRKGPQYREDVFKRLALQNIKTGYVDIASELKEQKRIVIEEENETKKQKTDQEEPKKIGKKLIIRNVEFKIPEKEKKEVEERFVEKEIREKEEKEQTKEVEADKIISEEDSELEEEGLRRLIEATERTTEVVEEKTEKPKRGRKPKKKDDFEPEIVVDLTTAVIDKMKVTDRLPKEREKRILATSSFYMNNRKIFIQKLSELFKHYREDLLKNDDDVSCESLYKSNQTDLLNHQKVVRDYLNLYTPYRGLLIYHSLGSGKTCSSIAVAEGMKSNKRVFILTPASLKMNFFSEMKKCGDDLYKKNQFWEFVSIEGKPNYVAILSKALSLSTDYIKKHQGAWMVNVTKEPNFGELSSEEQKRLDEQLNEMIRTKYTDINYNGLNMNKLNLLTGDQTRNPFDNSVVIIDEAHNFVSRIVNKVKQNKTKTIAYILYDYLMSAKNARIVLLSGTPIINYPNEIGILFNILRGYIKSWAFTINVKTTDKITTDTILEMFDKENFKTYDFVEYNGNVLTVTRNPFGFINTKKRGATKGVARGKKGGSRKIKSNKQNETKKASKKTVKLENLEEYDEEGNPINYAEQNYRIPQDPYEGGGPTFDKYDGVKLDETGNISDFDFQEKILSILKKNNLEVQKGAIKVTNYKALPDTPDSFFDSFVNSETGEVKNINLFQRRILGLTSYFKSAQEKLLPSFVKTDKGEPYHIVKTEMSPHQFGIYEKIRNDEADRESKNKKRRLAVKNPEELYQISSTYRIFSRAACNFVFPTSIERPVPNVKSDKELSENVFDAISISERKNTDIYASVDDEENKEDDEAEITQADETKYEERIKKAMDDVNIVDDETKKSKYLSKDVLKTYSPKFVKVLENLSDENNKGLHLLYSHFRTIEGIGILKLILEANGFAEFKIKKTGNNWELIELEEDKGKPKFVLYTGTETPEEKEIIRNVYNSAWEFVPVEIVNKIRELSENNYLGEIIKIFMITSSGAEGINLKNTRFVHIIEPYWHMVRIDQVVGRARRICSHQDLPEEMRTVKVFLYITALSEQQKTDDKNIELRIRDLSRIDNKTPVTTDETLFEISSIKQKTNNQILKAVKETSIDCQLYSNISKKSKDDENLVCFGFGKIESNQFSSYPSFENDRSTKEGLDVEIIKWEAIEIKEDGIKYALNEDTMDVYDFESYQRAKKFRTELIFVGKLVRENGEYVIRR
uniref:Helicase ATP-binding domain-containing protein n=1 Tax=viral metagenome TaxID=1070528 RepID=A0A6C0JPA7_9ZZZZ